MENSQYVMLLKSISISFDLVLVNMETYLARLLYFFKIF